MKTDTLPKSEWGPGPWQDEPDEKRWIDEATGLRCAILRSEETGAICGYVEIDHPAVCRPLEELHFQVHGGITYAGLLFGKETGWWIGFGARTVLAGQCNPLDVMPAEDARLSRLGQMSAVAKLIDALSIGGFRLGRSYKDIAFVRKECASLARQVRLASRRAR
jgi:hypothetical protein